MAELLSQFERSVLNKQQLAQKTGKDQGEDLFVQVGVCKLLPILGQILEKILANSHFTCWDLNVRYFHYL